MAFNNTTSAPCMRHAAKRLERGRDPCREVPAERCRQRGAGREVRAAKLLWRNDGARVRQTAVTHARPALLTTKPALLTTCFERVCKKPPDLIHQFLLDRIHTQVSPQP